MRYSALNRRLHRWGAVLFALPVLVIIASGIVLHLKKHSEWIQPATLEGKDPVPRIDFSRILNAARTAEEAGIRPASLYHPYLFLT